MMQPSHMRILPLIAEGLSNKEIAERLRRSPLSVRNEVSFIMAELGVKRRGGVGLAAVRRGLISIDAEASTRLDGETQAL